MALAAITILPSLSFAGPKSITCTTSISETVNANVVVPKGAECVFTPNATINGNVSVEEDATLLVGHGVTINQNLEAYKDSLVLIGPAATLKGNYSASGASTGVLESNLAQNVTLNGGTFAVLGNVVGSITCGGGATGSIATTVGVLNSGCIVGNTVGVLEDLGMIVDRTSSGSGSSKQEYCARLNLLIEIYSIMADIDHIVCDVGGDAGACADTGINSGKATAFIQAYLLAGCAAIQ
jgi:hypothetical protein